MPTEGWDNVGMFWKTVLSKIDDPLEREVVRAKYCGEKSPLTFHERKNRRRHRLAKFE